jgi:glycosyltransferase involved in cell wall biosynthesis
MVTDGENGLIFKTGDHARLAQALMRLYEDRAYLARLSDGARRHYRERLTADGMVRRLEAMYERLVGEKGRERPHAQMP